MTYKVSFEIDCCTTTEKQLREGLKYLDIEDVDEVISFPKKIKVTRIK